LSRNAIPLLLFVGLVGFLAVGLTLNPRSVPSPLIGQPVPAFELRNLHSQALVTPASLKGRAWLLNVWASWCEACKHEHKYFVQLQQETDFMIVGLNYKDTRREALAWLAAFNDPYNLIVEDQDGSLGLDLGVYGVPETFVVDAAGIIQYKFTGPVNRQEMVEEIIPLLQSLDKANDHKVAG